MHYLLTSSLLYVLQFLDVRFLKHSKTIRNRNSYVRHFSQRIVKICESGERKGLEQVRVIDASLMHRPIFFLSWRDSPLVGFGLFLIHEDFCGFLITHNDTPQSVGLLWTSDQLAAETSTWQHTTLTTDKHPCPRWDSNPRSQQASGRTLTP